MPRARLSAAPILGWLVAATAGCQLAAMPAPRPELTEDAGTPIPADTAPARPTQPSGWADDLRLRAATDLNPDPQVMEIRLEARVSHIQVMPGVTSSVWSYDGGLPGPLIRLRKGSRLIVHFTNHLPEETTVHWHGLRIPVAMDGVPAHSQPPVKPGGTFDYDFVVPDAGMFWYHPHVRSAGQVGDGLYGPLIVDDPAEPAGFGDELPLVLSDMSIDEDGTLHPHDQGGSVGTLFGREGNVLLVNGRVQPLLMARAGVRQRWRIVNAARSRYFQLVLPNHRFTRIGGDGGLLPSPVTTDRVVLTPGERADLVVEPAAAPGSTLALRWVAYDRGYGSAFFRPDVELMRLQMSADAPVEPPPLPATGRRIEPLNISKATPVAIEFSRNDVNGELTLGINGKPFGGDDHFHARVGETQLWTITNGISWDHPFHLHGFFFQVVDEQGVPVPPLEWKDTANVSVKGTTRIAVKYDDRPGMWMFHCHILDHADAGMMGTLMLQ